MSEKHAAIVKRRSLSAAILVRPVRVGQTACHGRDAGRCAGESHGSAACAPAFHLIDDLLIGVALGDPLTNDIIPGKGGHSRSAGLR